MHVLADHIVDEGVHNCLQVQRPLADANESGWSPLLPFLIKEETSTAADIHI
jgi:hypothetical protein